MSCGCNSLPVTTNTCCNNTDPNLICDDRYVGLNEEVRLKLLGVKPGTACQSLLANDTRGFIFDDASGMGHYSEPEPKITLPSVTNPSFLLVATGVAPHPWKFMEAPADGDFILQSVDGQFELTDAGTLPGVVTPCYNANLAAEGKVLVCTPTGSNDGNGDPIFTVKKLDVDDNRVIVGDTGNIKSLADADNLEHPKALIPEFRSKSYQKVDALDADIAGGLDVRPNAGDGSGAVLCLYDATTKGFFRAPATTKVQYNYSGETTSSANGNFNELGSHAKIANVVCNYPDVLISTSLQFKNYDGDDVEETVNNVDLAIYVDGVEEHVWLIKGSVDVSVTALITGLSIGTHSFAIRAKKTAGTGKIIVKNSSLTITTVL
jgi:hypothetical protein